MRRSLKALYRIYHAQGRMEDAAPILRLMVRGWVHLPAGGNLARVFCQLGIEPAGRGNGTVTFTVPGGWVKQERGNQWTGKQ